MAHPASLADARRPTAVHEAALRDQTSSVPWVTLADIKDNLGFAHSSRDADARLAKSLVWAVGYLEKVTGRSFSDTSRVAEYTGWDCERPMVLAVDSPDATVTAVRRIDATGTSRLVPEASYEVVYQNARPYVRLLDDADAFSPAYGEGVWAKVEYTTAFRRDSREAAVARGLVLELVAYDQAGEDVRADPRSGHAFKRAVQSLLDMTPALVAGRGR